MPCISHCGIRSVIIRSENVAEILVLELGVVPHTGLVTGFLVGRSVLLIAMTVHEEHVNCGCEYSVSLSEGSVGERTKKTKMATELDGIANKEADSSTSEVRRLRRLDDERASEISPAIGSTAFVSTEGCKGRFMPVFYLQYHSTGQRAMGVAGHIGGNRGQSDGKSNGLRVHKPEANKSPPRIGSGQESHASRGYGAEHVRDRGS